MQLREHESRRYRPSKPVNISGISECRILVRWVCVREQHKYLWLDGRRGVVRRRGAVRHLLIVPPGARGAATVLFTCSSSSGSLSRTRRKQSERAASRGWLTAECRYIGYLLARTTSRQVITSRWSPGVKSSRYLLRTCWEASSAGGADFSNRQQNGEFRPTCIDHCYNWSFCNWARDRCFPEPPSQPLRPNDQPRCSGACLQRWHWVHDRTTTPEPFSKMGRGPG